MLTSSNTTTITLREAGAADLVAVNRLIDAAIMTWDLPERVKRLSRPSYHYKSHDLETIKLVVEEDSAHHVVGIAAWEPVGSIDALEGYSAMLLHGLYVMPDHHHQGIGTQLLRAAEQAAIDKGFSGLLVKAQASAAGFFKANGMQPLEVGDTRRDYKHRYWKLLKH
ncbi:MAG: GNAT family N-acetyltransferase [Gammaproteobacteria bacterium]|nr:GNAT family N-acetyltransferase [Gammaproteobacteria bacterium]